MASEVKKVLFNDQSLTTTTISSVFDLDYDSKDYIMELQAANVNAATTLTVTVEHSSDQVVWYPLFAFTPLVGVDGNELDVSVNKSLNFVRANAVLAGATQAADVTVKVLYRGK